VHSCICWQASIFTELARTTVPVTITCAIISTTQLAFLKELQATARALMHLLAGQHLRGAGAHNSACQDHLHKIASTSQLAFDRNWRQRTSPAHHAVPTFFMHNIHTHTYHKEPFPDVSQEGKK